MLDIIIGVLFISSAINLVFALVTVILDILGIVKNQLLLDKMFDIVTKIALFHMAILIVFLILLIMLVGYSLIKGGI